MTTWVGAEEAMVDQWVKAQLVLQATALDALSTGLSTRIYLDVAPKDAVLPVIVYQCQDQPRDVRGVGTFTVMVDTLYLVKVISKGVDNATNADVAKVIHTAMTSSNGSSVGDGAVLTSVRERAFKLAEFESGVQYRHLGGIYRIQAQG